MKKVKNFNYAYKSSYHEKGNCTSNNIYIYKNSTPGSTYLYILASIALFTSLIIIKEDNATCYINRHTVYHNRTYRSTSKRVIN